MARGLLARGLAPQFRNPATANLARGGTADIRRAPGDKKIVGEDWHTDTTMSAEPPMGAILYAVDVPLHGGDTAFANQHLA